LAHGGKSAWDGGAPRKNKVQEERKEAQRDQKTKPPKPHKGKQPKAGRLVQNEIDLRKEHANASGEEKLGLLCNRKVGPQFGKKKPRQRGAM